MLLLFSKKVIGDIELKLNYKCIHIGRRTLKSAIAVILALMVVSMFGTTSASSRMVFALLGAMAAMENTFKQSLEACMAQFIGMILELMVLIAEMTRK